MNLANIFKKDPDKSFIVNYAPLFTNLSHSDKNLIISKSKVVEYKKGDIIYKQYDVPDAFYCVISGRVRIFVTMGLEEKTLESLSCGKYFGIISLLTGEPHSVSALASNDSKILKIAKEDFNLILNKIPKLAIDLSSTLSRRLRKKDITEKKVFETNIISIFGAIPGIGRTMYATNLALSLKKETGKNMVLINISEMADEKSLPISLDTTFFSDEFIKKAIYQDSTLGISILNVQHKIVDEAYAKRLNVLLTYLTGDFHYIVVDLPALMDEIAVQVLGQSDIVYLLTDYDAGNLEKTKVLINELFQKLKYPQEKIKVIIHAKKEAKYILPEEAARLLTYKIYADLPAFEEEETKVVSQAVLEHPQAEYSKAIRRIARELGDVRIGLALSGGAALGLAHIGVLKVLEKENIPIDIMSGSSMGALIGALWAVGLSAQRIEEIALEYNNNKKKVFRLLVDPCFPKLSFFKGNRIRAFLEKHIGNKTFQDIKFPFKVVACNLSRRQALVIDSGSLIDAVMASIAIPGVFAPRRINGDLLIDGGVVEAIPVGALVNLGIKKIIAVNTLPSPENIASSYEFTCQCQAEERRLAESRGWLNKTIYEIRLYFSKLFRPNILDVIINSIQTMEYVIAETASQKADVLISPAITGVDWFELYKAQTLIKNGEEATQKALAEIRELINE